jgi:hypothetical protein
LDHVRHQLFTHINEKIFPRSFVAQQRAPENASEAFQETAYGIVITDHFQHGLVALEPEDNSRVATDPEFKVTSSHLPDPRPAVQMRFSETLGQDPQRLIELIETFFRKRAGLSLEARSDINL